MEDGIIGGADDGDVVGGGLNTLKTMMMATNILAGEVGLLGQTDFPAVPAETLKWTLVAAVSLCGVVAGAVGFVRSLREPKLKVADEPPVRVRAAARLFNHDLAEERHQEHERRLRGLEEWRTALTEKLERDKAEIIGAGAARAEGLHRQMAADRQALDERVEQHRRELSDKLDGLPGRVIAILKATRAI